MPVIENPPRTATTDGESTSAAVRATRFDPPHEIPRAETAGEPSDAPAVPVEASDELAFALAGMADVAEDAAVTTGVTPALVRQFRTQAQQLASHLESRQRELDHRESELHAQLARHEAAARSARLWFQEQNRKLAQRQAEWERREHEISGRVAAAGKIASQFTAAEDTAANSSAKFSAIDDEIDFRLRQSEFHELSAQLEARYHHCDSLTKQLDLRHEQLSAAEDKLARGESELQFARRELQAQRAAYAARVERQQRQWSDERSRVEAEQAQRRAELDERTAQLEKRVAAVQQLRGELLQIQRETLESQLAAEELRAELAGKTPPAALLQSLARLRANLTQQYRLQADDLAQQRQQLADCAAQVALQQQQLAARQREFESWTIGQQRQLEEQAAQLAGREEQLEREQIERADGRLQREAQRRELETEIRRLQTHLRRLQDTALDQI